MRLSISMLMVVAAARWGLGPYVLATPSSLQSPLLRPPSFDGISEETYGELERFAKYSSAVYQLICPRPLGNKLVQSVSRILRLALLLGQIGGWLTLQLRTLVVGGGAQFSNVLTHTHGFVARDDGRREIVVAFRGSRELADMVTGTTRFIMRASETPRSLYRFFLQMATSFWSRWCPVASRTTRPRFTPASSCRTIPCVARCSASCVDNSMRSRAMRSSPPVCTASR